MIIRRANWGGANKRPEYTVDEVNLYDQLEAWLQTARGQNGVVTVVQDALDLEPPDQPTIAAADITDAGATGRALVQATTQAEGRAALDLAAQFAALAHTHLAANVTDLQPLLDAKAALVHGHAIADVTSLQGVLDGKAATVHAHSAADITSGTLDPARLPPGGITNIVPAGGTIASLTVGEQALLDAGDFVTEADGEIWAYSGTGSKTAEASYVRTGVTNPDWTAIQNKPATFTPSAHTHPDATASTAGFMTAAGFTKLGGIEAGATGDQTAAEIKTAFDGLVPAATQVEAQAGTATAIRQFTPARVREAILALTPQFPGNGNGIGANAATAVLMTSTEAQIGSVTITPSSVTAKIFLFAIVNYTKDSTTTSRTFTGRIRRGTTNGSTQVGRDSVVTTSVGSQQFAVPITYVDTPGVTTATTYSVRGTVNATSSAGTASAYSLVAVEIASSATVTGASVAAALATPAGAAGLAATSIASPLATRPSRTLQEILDLSVSATRLIGRDPDGTTDDIPALQEALDAGERYIRFEARPNPYLAKTTLNVRGKHGLHLIGHKGGKIVGHSTLTKAVLSTWNANDPFDATAGTGLAQEYTVRALTGRCRPGQTVLPPLATIGDAALFAVGDYVFPRCGDVTTGVPLCEMNRVRAVNTVTGVLTLEWPINWPYRTMGDGSAYGVANITPIVTERVRLLDLELQHATFRPVNLFHMVDVVIRGLVLRGIGAVGWRMRHFDVDFRAILEGVWSSTCRPYATGLDAGSSNGFMRCIATSQGLAICHLHESLANIGLDLDIQCGPTDAGPAEAWPVVSVKAITRNLHFRRVRVVNAPGGGPAIGSGPSTPYPSFGNHNIQFDEVTVEGTVTTGRAFDHQTGQSIALVKHLHTADATAPTPGLGSGIVAADRLTKSVTLVAGIAPATGGTDAGEAIWICADAASVGVAYEEDIEAGGWTHAELAIETWNAGDADGGDVSWHLRYRAGPAGVALDMTGTQDATLVQTYAGTGSPRIIRISRPIGGAGRVGLSLLRNGAGVSDTLAADTYILAKAALTYFKQLGGTATEGLNLGKLTSYHTDPVDQSATTYTALRGDSGKLLRHTNASAITVTLNGASLASGLPKGWKCTWVQGGAGQITFATANGMNLRNRSSHTKTAGLYAKVELEVIASNECVLSGDTGA